MNCYQLSGVEQTCNMEQVKAHYYRSHEDINPTGLVPVGPVADWEAPHDRARLGGSPPLQSGAVGTETA